MNALRNIYAVVPIKETDDAKRRLGQVLAAARRQELALAMFEDVLATLTRVRALAGIIVVTADSAAAAIALSALSGRLLSNLFSVCGVSDGQPNARSTRSCWPGWRCTVSRIAAGGISNSTPATVIGSAGASSAIGSLGQVGQSA